ncbi:putative urea ABC transporter substrate-binding protein [Niveispirillum sp. KHB5.9]|uniref:putative urea ABC transporter substrate-binding protein n=1 Tax=Niveispirillum sp. KHB5.9 TaxID=3400269 RepID=UPI003A86383F
MMTTRRFLGKLTAGLVAASLLSMPALAAPKKDFKLAWSIYVGWMPWQYAAEQGIVKKWADKYGISIEVVQFNDYVESINQYTAGAFDAVTVTNMDALSIPAAGGVDTTAVIVGDFSNGNDAVILKGKDKLADLKGQKVNLVEYSVSHYLLARALESAKLTEKKDVTVVSTSDADMVAAWSTADVSAVVTWNPLVAEILATPGAKKVFDSSQIPGEIIDLTVANSDVLKDNPAFGKALAGIWYETMAMMSAQTPAGTAARTAMGKASGTDLAGYESQLKATRMFYTPKDALGFVRGSEPKATMQKVAGFLFDHGLLGNGAPSAEAVGIEFPDGVTYGNAKFVKLRFTDTYMAAAADGKL